MAGLTRLSLYKTKVNDLGLDKLQRLTGLQKLYLPPKITDRGLACLKTFTDLNDLSLDKTEITDDGLAQLTELTKLENLSMEDTRVTDTGLKFLKSLKGLRSVWLRRTAVTPNGVKELEQSLPQCAIVR